LVDLLPMTPVSVVISRKLQSDNANLDSADEDIDPADKDRLKKHK